MENQKNYFRVVLVVPGKKKIKCSDLLETFKDAQKILLYRLQTFNGMQGVQCTLKNECLLLDVEGRGKMVYNIEVIEKLNLKS